MAELITDSQNTVHVTSDDADSQQTNAMEFHLTMEHSSQYCPAQNPDLIRALRERYDQREQRSKETGVRLRFFVSGEPTHVAYALLKADSVENVRRWLMKYPVAQDVIVTPVQPMATLLSSG
jgi:muconolactone delta-isomerase